MLKEEATEQRRHNHNTAYPRESTRVKDRAGIKPNSSGQQPNTESTTQGTVDKADDQSKLD